MNSLKLLVAATALGMATQAYAAQGETGRVNNSPKVSFVDSITGKTESVLRCGFVDPSPAERASFEKKIRDFRRSAKSSVVNFAVSTTTIPVRFHVITTRTGAGDVADTQIADQIAVLNAAYAGSGYQFTLAGTDRTANTNWYNGCANSGTERAMKRGLAIDPLHNFNVYACGLGSGLLGYATFPSTYPESSFMHGVVMLNSSLPGGSANNYNLGDTLTHEAGHYLGLFHPFQGGCTPPGDSVADTPAEASPASGCPVGRDSCTGVGNEGLDPITNFMDYSYDSCMNTFTTDQRIRMQDSTSAGRPNLGH